MQRLNRRRTILIFAGWFIVPLVASAQNEPVALKHGIYVEAHYRCHGAPNAAIRVWDGTGFQGAHSSKCAFDVAHTKGNRFQITTRCAALGDGTPNPDETDFKESFLLTRVSNTRFEILKGTEDAQTFRWCSLKTNDE